MDSPGHRPRRPRSLFLRAFLLILSAQGLLVLGVAIVFGVAVQRSVEDWNIDRGQRVQNVLIPEITRVYRTSRRLSEEALHQALSPFITGSVSAYITNADGDGVYLNVAGQLWSIHDPRALNEQLSQLPELLRQPAPVLEGGRVIAYLHTDTMRFREDLTNQRLLQRLYSLSFGGLLAALVAALVVALIFSRLMVRQAQELARGITALAQGERDVRFAPGGPMELQEIARSAAVLQHHLLREEELRRRWTEDIAHDLRTPVTALKTQLEGVTEGYLPATEERTGRLFQEVLRIERLVTDLRELSSVESPEARVQVAPIDPASFISDLRARYDAVAAERGVQFSAVARGSWFQGDEHLLRRVVSNVLDNAFRHAVHPAAPEVRLHVGPAGQIRVTNTGEVDPEELPRVFDRLYKGRGAAAEAGGVGDSGAGGAGGAGAGDEGRSGLGLAIARAIVHLHGGTITMFSREGITTVQILLPDEPRVHQE